MSWKEFSYMINGLGPDTPLGRIVSIRAEDDKEVLKTFTKEQRRIRNEYRIKQAKNKTKKEIDAGLEDLRQAFIRMAGVTNEKT